MTNQNNVPLKSEQKIQPDKVKPQAHRPKSNKLRSVSGVERLPEEELCKLREIALDRGRELQIRFNLRGLA